MMRKIAPFLVVLIFSLVTIRSFFVDGFFPMHDDAQVARVIVMADALKHGQYPVRMVANLGYGYGYPLFNFYGPLPYYIGGILHVIGLDALTATKIMIAIGIVIGSVSMFMLSSSIFGVFGGIFSSMLFTYFPYRAVQVFVRGAVGELWAISFLPFVLYGILLIGQKKKQRVGFLIGSFSLSAIILSHTVFGYISMGMFIVIAMILCIISFFEKRELLRPFALPIVGMCLVALGVTSFFWLPAMTEMNYTNVNKVIGKTSDYKDHFVCISQLWDSQWGYGGSAPGCLDGMSYKLGKLQILFVILTFVVWICAHEKSKRINIIMIGTCLSGLLFLFLTLHVSEPLWRFIPYSSYIQYPWRLLGPVGLCMSLFCGYVLYKRKTVISVILLCIFSGGIFLFNAKLFSPQYIYPYPIETYRSMENLRFRASGVSDEYLPQDIPIPSQSVDIVHERVSGNESRKVTIIREDETSGAYKIEAGQPQELKLHMAYFPGWNFYLNGTKVEPKVVEGQPSVILSAGYTLLEMRFSDTWVRRVGNSISLVTILGIIILFSYGKKAIGFHRHTCL